MANHQIPRRARRVERIHGIDADGNVVTCSVYEHTRDGHGQPMFYVVQYREDRRYIDPASRVTREYTGPGAGVKMAREVAEVRDLLADSRLAEQRRLFG